MEEKGEVRIRLSTTICVTSTWYRLSFPTFILTGNEDRLKLRAHALFLPHGQKSSVNRDCIKGNHWASLLRTYVVLETSLTMLMETNYAQTLQFYALG